MTSGTCPNIRPANFVTRVQQSRIPKFVNDIFSAFGTHSRVRWVCGPCAVFCGAVRCCAVLCGTVRLFGEADGSTPSYLRPLPTFALQMNELTRIMHSATTLICFEVELAVTW
jgi:hypothetical protein